MKIRILEIEGANYLRLGEYVLAEKRFKEELDLFLQIQKEARIRIHKGSPYHNLGISLLFQGDTDGAIEFIVSAYMEDLISKKNLQKLTYYLRAMC